MKGYLLDLNTLIALAWPNHVHHRTAHEWFGGEHHRGWGTCSLTQVGFVRISSNPAFEHHVSSQEAFQKLQEIVAFAGHSFWPEPKNGYADDYFVRTIPKTLTHGMVTDGFLATTAALNGGKLATFDKPLARAFPECCMLIKGGD